MIMHITLKRNMVYQALYNRWAKGVKVLMIMHIILKRNMVYQVLYNRWAKALRVHEHKSAL